MMGLAQVASVLPVLDAIVALLDALVARSLDGLAPSFARRIRVAANDVAFGLQLSRLAVPFDSNLLPVLANLLAVFGDLVTVFAALLAIFAALLALGPGIVIMVAIARGSSGRSRSDSCKKEWD